MDLPKVLRFQQVVGKLVAECMTSGGSIMDLCREQTRLAELSIADGSDENDAYDNLDLGYHNTVFLEELTKFIQSFPLHLLNKDDLPQEQVVGEFVMSVLGWHDCPEWLCSVIDGHVRTILNANHTVMVQKYAELGLNYEMPQNTLIAISHGDKVTDAIDPSTAAPASPTDLVGITRVTIDSETNGVVIGHSIANTGNVFDMEKFAKAPGISKPAYKSQSTSKT